MASIIVGTAIFTAIYIKDRKSKKKEEARRAAAAHRELIDAQQQSVDGYYARTNFANTSTEALPAYTPVLKRQASSLYSQDSGTTLVSTERSAGEA